MAEANQVPGLAKAKLIPLDDKGAESDESKHIKVQFNPSSLKVTLANTLKADSKSNDSGTAAQFVDKSSSSLSIELMFDTTVGFDAVKANTDVRLQTQKIAEAFMKPIEGSNNKMRAPARCRFQWGAFKFVGMVGSYNETLDFFSPEGIPLRARLSLSLKEDKYQFERDDQVKAKRGQLPNFSKAPKDTKKKQTGDTQTLNEALKNENKDEAKFRSTAMANGVEDTRQLNAQPLQVAKNDPVISETRQMDGSSASPGFSQGNSAALGSRIPGAFSHINKTSKLINQAEIRAKQAQQKAEQIKRRLQSASKRIQDVRDN